MFAVMIKNGELKAAYSKDDIEYLQRRGWAIKVEEVEETAPIPEPIPAKKRGRPAKAK